MKVLIPIDGSHACNQTLQWITQTLNLQQCEFYLLHVVPLTLPEATDMEDEIEETMCQMLPDAATFLIKAGGVVMEKDYFVYTKGNTVQAICDYAQQKKIDLIVIGSHGKTHSWEVLMGSVSQGVFKHSENAVVIYNNKHALKACDCNKECKKKQENLLAHSLL